MGETVNIGRRIELVPMDLHFESVTLALYCQEWESTPAYRVHTYSRKEGIQERIEFVVRAMETLGGMEQVGDGLLRFPCGAGHEFACRRVFLEACKQDPAEGIEVRPLHTLDKKSGLTMVASGFGDGRYRVTAEGEGKDPARRVGVIVNGLMKLGEMLEVEGREEEVGFACGQTHDAMVGLLLVRAPNVRALVREQEDAASRGMLAAPSQQR
ncbi:MAG: hypothetical protein O2954_11445 [bacterium]|nr:hypothetical protein [bacterium]